MYPASPTGRFFSMIFALFGIPLNGILFANLADYFGSKVPPSSLYIGVRRNDYFNYWLTLVRNGKYIRRC